MPDTTMQISQVEWPAEHSQAATKEGWDIFECFGSATTPWQVQRLDDASDVPGAPQLDNDDDAWRIVLQGTQAHHSAALTFLRQHSPEEYEAMMVFAEKNDIIVAFVPGFTKALG